MLALTQEQIAGIKGLRIITNYTCLRQCPFCYQNGKPEKVYLSPDILRATLADIAKYDIRPTYFTIMGGEAMLNCDISELLQILKEFSVEQYNNIPTISLTTNGMGYIEDYAELISAGYIHQITFSMHLYNADMHDYIRYLMGALKERFPLPSLLRVNTFVGEDVSEYCINYINNVALGLGCMLTFCTDIRANGKELNDILIKRILGVIAFDTEYTITPSGVVVNKELDGWNKEHSDGKSTWIVTHDQNNYGNDNIIILPSGKTTLDFNDVINCVV